MPKLSDFDLDPTELKIIEAVQSRETSFTMLREVKHIIGSEGKPKIPNGRVVSSYNRTVIVKLCKIIEKLTKPE